MTRRLLTIAHSYVVGLNRRLAHEMARASGGRWDVTIAAPRRFHGDLGALRLEVEAEEPCDVHGVRMYGSRSLPMMMYGRQLRSLLDRQWDLVHCWEEPFIAAGGQVAAWTRPHTPLVYATFQNTPRAYPRPFSWIERYAMRRATGWIAFGETVSAALSARVGYRDRPHRVIPAGVDLDRFRPDSNVREVMLRRLGWNAHGGPVVGYVGRFVPQKGLACLMAALDQVPGNWRALFVGGGVLEPTLRNWAASHPERVRIVSGTAHNDVADCFNAMDLVCVPSLSTPRWCEQLGRVVLEAFACGVPVIASNSGELPSVIGDAGEIVPEGVVAEWTARITALLHDDARRIELSSRGLSRAHERFAWPVVARQHLEFFEQMAA